MVENVVGREYKANAGGRRLIEHVLLWDLGSRLGWGGMWRVSK